MTGYAVGVGGTTFLFETLLSTKGSIAMLSSYAILAVGVSIMSYLERIGIGASKASRKIIAESVACAGAGELDDNGNKKND